ncbi:toprim domain-containing protein [Octadecabacter sp.]|nr:toprim domain-containing protein [Octadecabacter sp.]
MDINYPLSPKARKCGHGWVDICPAHNDQNPSLSVGLGADGTLLLHCFAGCAFSAIVQAAGLAGTPNIRQVSRGDLEHIKHERELEAARKRAYAQRLWRESGPIDGTLSEQYLASRGIRKWSDTQRHHTGLIYAQTGERLPVLITAVQRAGQLVGLHRTYLNLDGTKRDKMMIGPCGGGAAHLLGTQGPLIVAEGIETALSLYAFNPDTVARYWAALSAGGVRALELPKPPNKLVIAADGDTAGTTAANDLGQRAALAGWDVVLMAAPNGQDWNDVLMERRNG